MMWPNAAHGYPWWSWKHPMWYSRNPFWTLFKVWRTWGHGAVPIHKDQLKRYSLVEGMGMQPRPDGRWVKYEDIA